MEPGILIHRSHPRTIAAVGKTSGEINMFTMLPFGPYLRASLRVLICVILTASPSLLFGEEQVSRIESPSPDALRDRTEWYGTYFQDQKCGWARITQKKVNKNGKKYFIYEMESTQKIISMGETHDDYLYGLQEFMAEPPYSFVRGESQIKQGGSVFRIHVDNRGEDVLAIIEDSGQKREMTIPNVDFCFLDLLTAEDWIRGNPAVGDRLKVRDFSCQDLKTSIDTYEVIFSGEKKIQDKREKVLEVTWADSNYGNIGRITFNPEGRALLIRQGDFLEMRLEDEREAKKIASGADYFLGGTATIDQKLGAAPEDIAGLVLDVTGEAASDLKSGPGMSVTYDERNKTSRIITGYHQTPKIKATQEDIADNSKETLEYPIDDSEVQVLARQSTGDAKNDRDRVREMIAFVDRFLEEDASSQILTVKETIQEKKGDCSERAALMVTLSRANGIPAREVHGLMYTSDLFMSFGGHSWCEVILDGVWVPVDPTWGQLCADGTHIRFDYGDKGLAQLVKMMGGLSFHLVDIELAEPADAGDPALEKTGKQ